MIIGSKGENSQGVGCNSVSFSFSLSLEMTLKRQAAGDCKYDDGLTNNNTVSHVCLPCVEQTAKASCLTCHFLVAKECMKIHSTRSCYVYSMSHSKIRRKKCSRTNMEFHWELTLNYKRTLIWRCMHSLATTELNDQTDLSWFFVKETVRI